MDWKTFFVDIISTITWPITIIFILFFFKDKIFNLIDKITTIKYKDAEINFVRMLDEIVPLEEIDEKYNSKEILELKNTLTKLIDISPRLSIIESYRVLENYAVKAIKKANPNLDEKYIRTNTQITKMLRENILSTEYYFQLIELRNLRNTAVHQENFELTGKPINQFIDLTLSIINELDKFINK